MTDPHREAFREEAFETLVQLESVLLQLEAEPHDAELVGTAFRYLHTIKGSGAMFGFDDIASFTHEVETVFDLVRGGKIAVSKALIDLTLAARDEIRIMLGANVSDDGAERVEKAQIVASLRRLLPEPAPKHPSAPRQQERAMPPISHPAAAERTAYRIRFRPAPGIFLSGANPVLLLNELREMGSVTLTVNTDRVPTLEEISADFCHTAWDIVLVSSRGLEAIEDVFVFVDQESELTIEPIEDNPETPAEKRLGEILVERGDLDPQQLEAILGSHKPIGELLVESGLVSRHSVESALVEQRQLKEIHRERSSQEQKTSIRVPSERLDHLVNLVGEQVTVQARLSQLAQTLKRPDLASIAEEVARLTADLRESTLQIRMLPIGSTFSSFRRLVRDLSMELGKEIVMTTAGEETELDKTVIEKLNDPLVHMIRNCIDHAIETPQQRVARGKPRQGAIHLAAVHSGDSVYLSIGDDGAGLDREAIFAKALENELVPAGAQLTEKETFALIFEPGFSTAKAVTNVSGRGVGMDVVKRSIEDLRGSIDLKSELGRGTTITVRIPLTLAIIESLLVRIGTDHYMFPLSLVHECMFLTGEAAVRAHGRQVVNVRGGIVPYIRLRSLFATSGTPPALEQLVIAELDGKRIGFVVDKVIGQHQTVIKALGSAYKHVEGVSGASILGDGSVALILDVPKLYHAEELAADAA